jgi:glutathione peroxidase
MAACPALLDRKMDTILEKPQSLCDYAGKVVLVVNTASECGYTPQYEGLEALYRKYRNRGLVVLGFPSNDFGGQEPGSAKEIREFCSSTYKVNFPLFEKVVTKAGGEQSPIYANLNTQAKALPEWNFGKYLVAKNGLVIKYYKAGTKPDDATLRKDIETALAAK